MKRNQNEKEIKKQLTLYPLKGSPHASNYAIYNTKIEMFRMTPNYIRIPRHVALSKYDFSLEEPINRLENLEFSGNLRPDQKEVVDTALSALSDPKKGGGILELYCGFGKTVCALYLASVLKVRMMVVVHQENLLEQWKSRIATFLPNASIGRIQGSVCDTDKDIVLVMLKTFSTKKFDNDVFDFVIVDECDKIASKVYSNATFSFRSRYTLGLSATPYRTDSMDSIFLWSLGPILITKTTRVQTGKVQVYKYKPKTPYTEMKNKSDVVDVVGMMTQMVFDSERTKFIAEVIQKTLSDPKRKILVLSQRKNLLDDLHVLLGNVSGLYYGGMKIADKEESSQKRVVLGTFNIASVGLDIEGLNTLLLATSKPGKKYNRHGKEVQGAMDQAVGRIFRGTYDLDPLVIDIVDNFSVFSHHARKRIEFYKDRGYEIEHCET